MFNFGAGPAMMPVEVLEASARGLLGIEGAGMGVAEMSHRGKAFEAILDETISRCRSLLTVPDDYDILFLQGGATQLFTTIPMNFLQGSADYVVTGEWAKKAAQAAQPFGDVRVAASSEESGFDRIPRGWAASPSASYLHICANNTIYGSRWSTFPDHDCLIVDASSDLMSRPYDTSRCALIYAGAQKNMGCAGVTLAIVRTSLYERIPASVPGIFSFKKHADSKSCLNTPPTVAIYVMLQTFRWLERQGGLAEMEKRNEAKAQVVYQEIDRAPDFYRPVIADVANRSRMNVTFRLPGPELTALFVQGAKEQGMFGLAGYRTVGGIRASLYNAVPLAACEALAGHMRTFAKAHSAAARPGTISA
ncbi:MAG: 3-phosphoserine/phosphohydroxythreonine transaminase [Chloroflexota bacterium]